MYKLEGELGRKALQSVLKMPIKNEEENQTNESRKKRMIFIRFINKIDKTFINY